MYQDAIDSYTGLVIYIPQQEEYRVMQDVSMISCQIGNLQQTCLRKVFTLQIRGTDTEREDLVKRVKDKNVTILSRVEYGGYIVTKSYQETEYNVKIVSE